MILGRALPILLVLATACSDSATTTTETTVPLTTTSTTVVTTTTTAPSTTPPTTMQPEFQVVQADLRQVASDDPLFELLIGVPELQGLGDPEIEAKVNQYLLDVVTRTEQGFVRDVTQYLEEVEPTEGPASFLELAYDVRWLSPEVLSIRFHDTTFFQGAANPNSAVQTRNFDLTTGEMLELGDLFGPTEWAFAMDFLVRDAVAARFYEGDLGELDAWVDPDDLLVPEDFALGPTGFEFSFQELQVGPGVLGAPTVTVPYSAIGVYIQPGSLLERIAAQAAAGCDALAEFADTYDRFFEGNAEIDDVLMAAEELRVARRDLEPVLSILLEWAAAFDADPATELTGAQMDAIEASNDVIAVGLEECS